MAKFRQMNARIHTVGLDTHAVGSSAASLARIVGRKIPSAGRLVDRAVEDGGDLAHLVGQGDEFFWEKGLHTVGQSFVRLVMDFDEQAIRTDGDSGAGK